MDYDAEVVQDASKDDLMLFLCDTCRSPWNNLSQRMFFFHLPNPHLFLVKYFFKPSFDLLHPTVARLVRVYQPPPLKASVINPLRLLQVYISFLSVTTGDISFHTVVLFYVKHKYKWCR